MLRIFGGRDVTWDVVCTRTIIIWQFVATSAEVTPKGNLVRNPTQNGLDFRLFIINCPDSDT